MATMTLQQLSDRLEIDDLLTRYATALDGKDWDGWADCFTPDAHIDYTAAGGIKGSLAEVKQWLSSVMAGFPMTQHLVTNKVVAIDGDRAECRSALLNPMGLPDGDGMMLWLEGGYYRDRLVRTAAGWRIAERIEQPTFSTRRHRLIARTLAL
jgi:hypothetical protein